MTQVRSAQVEDRAGLLELCRLLHEENGQHTLCWPNVEAVVDRCIVKNGGVIGVIGPIGSPVAAIMMFLDRVWYSDEHQLLEFFNFVHADHRKTDYAKSLILYGKSISDELGIDLTVGVLSHHRMEAKVRLYGRLMPKNGEFFLYEPASKTAIAAAAAG